METTKNNHQNNCDKASKKMHEEPSKGCHTKPEGECDSNVKSDSGHSAGPSCNSKGDEKR